MTALETKPLGESAHDRKEGGDSAVCRTVVDLPHVPLDSHDGREGRKKSQAPVFGGAVQVPGAQQFHFQHSPEVLGRHELQEGVPDDACPVNHPVDPAVLFDHLVQGPGHFLGIRHVTAEIRGFESQDGKPGNVAGDFQTLLGACFPVLRGIILRAGPFLSRKEGQGVFPAPPGAAQGFVGGCGIQGGPP